MAITAMSFAAKLEPQNSWIRYGVMKEYKAMGKTKDAFRVGLQQGREA